jgi:thiol:disulfide interchange protein DsbD
MFGLYELQMPSFIQSLLHRHSSELHARAKGWLAGEFIGVFLLGLFSALIIGACVSPVLISTLGAAITTHNPWLGAAIMFALAHGQGAVLIAVGIGESALLPKAGPWMDKVKQFFGVLLLAVAIHLLGYLPQVPVLLLWGALLVVCAVFMGATQRLPDGAKGWRYVGKGLGTVLLIWGVITLIGAAAGGRDLLQPLPANLFSAKTAAAPGPLFERVHSLAQLEARLNEAKAAGKPVVLDYYADWCTDCVRMERSTFLDAGVRAEMAHFVRVQADLTNADDPQTKALKDRFTVFGPPATVFIASSGKELGRKYGYLDRDALLAILKQVN